MSKVNKGKANLKRDAYNKEKAIFIRKEKVAIIGAGPAGMTLAMELLKKGFFVWVYDRLPGPGGLAAGTNTLKHARVEKYYHHVFTNDNCFIRLVAELGLDNLIEWFPPRNAIYKNKRLYPFTTPLDLLKYPEIPFSDRIRLGATVALSAFFGNVEKLDTMTSPEFIRKYAGNGSYEGLWEPLLASKFDKDADEVSAVWIWNKFRLRGSSRKNLSSYNKEMLGYINGGFEKVYARMSNIIEKSGGRTSYNIHVSGITLNRDGKYRLRLEKAGKNENNDREFRLEPEKADKTENKGNYRLDPEKADKTDIWNGSEEILFDKVVYTGASEELAKLMPELPDDYKISLSQVEYKSNICVMLELDKKLTDWYWITVAEKDAPFVLVIEHTNMIPRERYDSSIVYLSRYLDAGDPLFDIPDQEIAEKFIDYLKIMFPDFKEASVKNITVNRERYAQPVVKKGFRKIMPEYETPFIGLYLINMSMIYPEDRGQNYAIREALKLAELIDSVDSVDSVGSVE